MGGKRRTWILLHGCYIGHMARLREAARARSPLAIRESPSHIRGMNLQLTDGKAASLEKELTAIIDRDRYFLSPRIQTLREIRNMIRPEPVREPLPEPKHNEPPRGGRYRRRG
jgi:hypothetical protein